MFTPPGVNMFCAFYSYFYDVCVCVPPCVFVRCLSVSRFDILCVSEVVRVCVSVRICVCVTDYSLSPHTEHTAPMGSVTHPGSVHSLASNNTPRLPVLPILLLQ